MPDEEAPNTSENFKAKMLKFQEQIEIKRRRIADRFNRMGYRNEEF